MPWEGHNAAEFAYGEGSAVGSEARARALYRKVLNLGVPSAHGHLEALKQFPQFRGLLRSNGPRQLCLEPPHELAALMCAQFARFGPDQTIERVEQILPERSRNLAVRYYVRLGLCKTAAAGEGSLTQGLSMVV